jgi:hypothetical protein
MPERLVDLGLTPVQPCEEAPGIEHSFEALPYLDAYVVKTSSAKLERSAKELLTPEYLIMPNLEMSAPTPARGKDYVRLPDVIPQWPALSGIAEAHRQGIKGAGVTVCVLDTGVDADHRELRHKEIDFRYIPFDAVAGRMRDCRGFDVDGHGTHVAGVIAGQHLGIAPDVDLMVAAVLESETLKTSLERVVTALDWLLAQFDNRGQPQQAGHRQHVAWLQPPHPLQAGISDRQPGHEDDDRRAHQRLRRAADHRRRQRRPWPGARPCLLCQHDLGGRRRLRPERGRIQRQRPLAQSPRSWSQTSWALASMSSPATSATARTAAIIAP